MSSQPHSLRQLFHDVVTDCYTRHLDLKDAELTSYVADMLTDFNYLEQQNRLHDDQGRPLDLAQMLLASDPVYGTAVSFHAERVMRRFLGDYALFSAGIHPEMMHAWPQADGQSFLALIQAGKESYYVVSQFNVFEFAAEAPMFSRLAANFEACVYGLNQVRRELQNLQANPAEQLRLV